VRAGRLILCANLCDERQRVEFLVFGFHILLLYLLDMPENDTARLRTYSNMQCKWKQGDPPGPSYFATSPSLSGEH
jgi:hypothetical protein